jgi:membrane protease YdiL (CAAX protease family)
MSYPDGSTSAEQDTDQPRWPAWYGPAAFVLALVIGSIFGAVVAAVGGALGANADRGSPTFTLAATLVLDAVMVACAVFLAALTKRPRLWHFGLRKASPKAAVIWALTGILSFYLLTAAYTEAFHPQGQQSVVQDLGANRGPVALIAAGIVVIVLAPVAEEFFFRGFFYKALRTRFPVLVAAVLDGVVFGLIHYTGPETLSILPLLGLLGFIFCLVYERVGSLYPVIALHSLNNAIAYGAKATGSAAASIILFTCMLCACFIIPHFQRVTQPTEKTGTRS